MVGARPCQWYTQPGYRGLPSCSYLLSDMTGDFIPVAIVTLRLPRVSTAVPRLGAVVQAHPLFSHFSYLIQTRRYTIWS